MSQSLKSNQLFLPPLIATIIGTLASGAFLSKIGLNRPLWLFDGLQAVSNLADLLLAQVGKNYQVLILNQLTSKIFVRV